jgi:hypothetical protein
MTSRRKFLLGAAALGLASGSPAAKRDSGAAAWNTGLVQHLLPTVNHDSILIKASFRQPLAQAFLVVEGKRYAGRMTDSEGEFWSFFVDKLRPAHRHTLTLTDGRGRSLCDSWPLTTFPRPGDQPARFRALIYTCAGGHPVNGRHLPLPIRARLLEKGLSYQPDALVAIGDHIYWDLRSGSAGGWTPEAIRYAGQFDRTMPIVGHANERVLKLAVSPQIVDLYDARCRSVPVFFFQDDHDHFENDEASDKLITFPPDAFNLSAARATQHMYYPEFLRDATRPLGLASSSASDRFPHDLSESFGTLRFGRLAELLMYDCRRHVTLTGPSAVFVPGESEAWLIARMAGSDAAHVVNIPSTPIGWTAGKWGEWYVDMQVGGHATTTVPKPYWQSGWRAQHDRLVVAASGMRNRVPLFISGDLHAIGEGRMLATGKHDLSRNPVTSILAGPLSTFRGWPSSGSRGMRPEVPAGIRFEETQPPIEQNGFIVADFTADRIVIRFFKWDVHTQTVADIDKLEPFRVTELKRPA